MLASCKVDNWLDTTANFYIHAKYTLGNKNWSCGGSSGGEGAMIGFRGGIIGVGTDIGKV
jgi:amidase